MLPVLRSCRYVEQLRRYHAVFPPEQVLVLIYDDFRRDNEHDGPRRAALPRRGRDRSDRVRRGQPDGARAFTAPRTTGGIAVCGAGPGFAGCQADDQGADAEGMAGEGFQAIRRRLMFGAQRAPDDAFMRELRSRFKPEVVALSDYLDRDLVTLWGYDSVG